MLNKLFMFFKSFFFKLKNLTLKSGSQDIIQVIVDYLEKNKYFKLILNFINNKFLLFSFMVLAINSVLSLIILNSFVDNVNMLVEFNDFSILIKVLLFFQNLYETSFIFFIGFFVGFFIYYKNFKESKNNNLIIDENKKLINLLFFCMLLFCCLPQVFYFIYCLFLYNNIYDIFSDYKISDFIIFHIIYLLYMIITLFIYYYFIQIYSKIEKYNKLVKLLFYLSIIFLLIIFIFFILIYIFKFIFVFKVYAMEDIALADCQNDLKNYFEPEKPNLLYGHDNLKTVLKVKKMGLIDFNVDNVKYETLCIPLEVFDKIKPLVKLGACKKFKYFTKKIYKNKGVCIICMEIMFDHFELVDVDLEKFKCSPIINIDNTNNLIIKAEMFVLNKIEDKINNEIKNNNEDNLD